MTVPTESTIFHRFHPITRKSSKKSPANPRAWRRLLVYHDFPDEKSLWFNCSPVGIPCFVGYIPIKHPLKIMLYIPSHCCWFALHSCKMIRFIKTYIHVHTYDGWKKSCTSKKRMVFQPILGCLPPMNWWNLASTVWGDPMKMWVTPKKSAIFSRLV